MHYPKMYMSITELTKIGLSRTHLNELAHARGAPIIRTMGGGKILFRTSELDKFMQEVSERSKGRIIYR